MKYAILLTLILLSKCDNVETAEEINLLGESQEPKTSLDEQSTSL